MQKLISFLSTTAGKARRQILLASRYSLVATALALSASAAAAPAASPLTDADQQLLTELVARQKTLFTRAAAATTQQTVDDLHPEFQSLINDYENLLRKNPHNPPLLVAYALFLNQPPVSDKKRSITLFLAANTLDPQIPLVKNQIGNYLAEDGKPAEALNYYFAAAQLDPNEALYHYQIGNLISSARDTLINEAGLKRPDLDSTMLRSFQRAADLSPQNDTYAFRNALAYFELETPHWNIALQKWLHLETLLKTGPEKQFCALYIAQVLVNQNKPAEARARLDTVIDIRLQAQKQKILAQLSTPPTGGARSPNAPFEAAPSTTPPEPTQHESPPQPRASDAPQTPTPSPKTKSPQATDSARSSAPTS